MSRTNAKLATVVIGLMAAVSLAVPATAQAPDVPPPREYGETGVRTGVVTVEAGAEWLPVGASRVGRSSSCTTSSVSVVVDDDFSQPVNREWRVFSSDGSIPFTSSPSDLPSTLPTFMRHFSPTGRWFAVTCDGVTRVVAEGGPAVTINGLVQRALDQIDPPDPDLAVTPVELHFTQLPSWLAIEPAYWNAPREARAQAGRVFVDAEVNPIESTWNMGDGTTVDCPGSGAGTVWAPGAKPTADSCLHTYRKTSAGAKGDRFEIEATVTFAVAATSNAPGGYGPFPNLERSTTQSIQVGEIQAVNN